MIGLGQVLRDTGGDVGGGIEIPDGDGNVLVTDNGVLKASPNVVTRGNNLYVGQPNGLFINEHFVNAPMLRVGMGVNVPFETVYDVFAKNDWHILGRDGNGVVFEIGWQVFYDGQGGGGT